MALQPRDLIHKKQIAAGTLGRNKGHGFEEYIAQLINKLEVNLAEKNFQTGQVIYNGDPAGLLISYIINFLKIKFSDIKKINAFWLGGLATSGKGDAILGIDGKNIRASKSDILLKFIFRNGKEKIIGVSTKTCNNKTPTNAQLFFTTAGAFIGLLRLNGVEVGKKAEEALRMFCGDAGFRPRDQKIEGRKSDPDRWFWEELPSRARSELENLFTKKQKEITDILLRKAYLNDPFPPDFIIHQTRKCSDINNCEVAILSVNELIGLSSKYKGFELRPYQIKKGRFKNDPSTHLAPRFGVVQMQRGGQKQHPTQLQFNLKSGYFYALKDLV